MKRKLDERLEQIDRYNLPHKFKGGHLPKECSTVAEVGDSVNEYRVNVKEHFPEYYHSHDRGLVLGQEIPDLYDLFCKELARRVIFPVAEGLEVEARAIFDSLNGGTHFFLVPSQNYLEQLEKEKAKLTK